MNKLKYIIVLLAFVFFSGAAFSDNLYSRFDGKDEIKVYMESFRDVSGKGIDAGLFKKLFSEALAKRINIKFVMVDDVRSADVVIICEARRYEYREKVLPRFFSAYALVADTTSPKSLAVLSMNYDVIEPATGKEIFTLRDFTTETRMPVNEMKGRNAVENAISQNVDRFVYRTFYKQKVGR